MSATAFALREDAKEDFAGASVTVGARAADFQIGDALADKDEYGPEGLIVTDDRVLIRTLKRGSAARILKEVPVPPKTKKALEKAESQEAGDAA